MPIHSIEENIDWTSKKKKKKFDMMGVTKKLSRKPDIIFFAELTLKYNPPPFFFVVLEV